LGLALHLARGFLGGVAVAVHRGVGIGHLVRHGALDRLARPGHLAAERDRGVLDGQGHPHRDRQTDDQSEYQSQQGPAVLTLAALAFSTVFAHRSESYILEGADTPIKPSPLRNTWRVAFNSASRASLVGS